MIYWWYTVNRELRDFARTVQPTHPLAASSPGTSTLALTLGAGSAAQVQRNVVHLQALAKASRQLGHAAPGHREWSALVTIEDAITDEHARLRLFSDDGSRSVKELEQKLESVRRALNWLQSEGLDPARLSAMANA